eukprot:jgi/Picsp_1/5448/NSC_02807-R1_flu chloroplast alternative spliced version s-flp
MISATLHHSYSVHRQGALTHRNTTIYLGGNSYARLNGQKMQDSQRTKGLLSGRNGSVVVSARQQTGDVLMREKATAVVVGAILAGSMVLSPPAMADAFLKSTGARGLLAEEEEQLYRLRQLEEGKVREELLEARSQLEEETKRSSDGKLCATPFGVDVVGITEFIALTGALVGGLSARRRKLELERLNEQLRTINMQLRQQARAGTLYAPGLTYAPTGGVPKGASSSPMATLVTLPTGAGSEVPPVGTVRRDSIVQPKNNNVGDNGGASADKDAVTVSNNSNGAVDEKNTTVSLTSIDEEDMRPEVKQCQAALKEGKRFLKEKDAGPALVRFEKALMLARAMGDRVRERRAVRGLAAANRILGRYPQAIEYLQRVLEISDETGDHIGDADAYGTIADIYTELGEFEKAAEFYDKYIGKMAVEGPV